MWTILAVFAILYIIFGEDEDVKDYCRFYLWAVGLIGFAALVLL